MFVAGLPDEEFNVQLFAEARIKLPQAYINLRAPRSKLIDALKQFAPEQLLRRVGKGRGL
jgi:hypothetical protein